MHCRGLLRKHHLDVLHLLCAKNVVRLSGVRRGCAVGDGRREPDRGNVIAVRDHRDVHADRGRLLVLGGWLDG